ncbi:MAG: hypothetical protein R2766_10380 [Saprospiraceae bacterium]
MDIRQFKGYLFQPKYQLIVTIFVGFIIIALNMISFAIDDNSTMNSRILNIALSNIIFFVLLNVIFGVMSDLKYYYRDSIYAFIALVGMSYVCMYWITGKNSEDFYLFKKIFIVLGICYVVFLVLMNLMKKPSMLWTRNMKKMPNSYR